jgi:hypothetical protein
MQAIAAAEETTDYSPDPRLTPLQNQVINLLAQGCTITEAAERTGAHRNTIGNWRRSVPAFAVELEHATHEQSLYWHDQAAALAPQAIEVICTILHNEEAAASVRLRAALAIVKMAADPAPRPQRPISISEPHLSNMYKPQVPTPLATNRVTPIRKAPEPGRNSPCPCGSNLKYKRCCGSVNPQPLAASQSSRCETSAETDR